jgi:bis(5'-adenosyl)-triphosphatase
MLIRTHPPNPISELYLTSPSHQVFYTTPLSYALVNIKPILPGHVLVVPFRLVPRLTDLTPAELQDLFCLVQKVQKMLARRYFAPLSSSESGTNPSSSSSSSSSHPNQEKEDPKDKGDASTPLGGTPKDASFNIAIQDGREAGQTVPHVHVHVIPRLRGDEAGDEVYSHLQAEEGNIGGGFWDREFGENGRPVQKGKFPRIEDKDRKPRDKEDMRREAEAYRVFMEEV